MREPLVAERLSKPYLPPGACMPVCVARWRIEEDHQQAKQTCGQVTFWHRWTAVCLLAYAYIFLSVTVALERAHDNTSAAG